MYRYIDIYKMTWIDQELDDGDGSSEEGLRSKWSFIFLFLFLSMYFVLVDRVRFEWVEGVIGWWVSWSKNDKTYSWFF